MPKFTQQLEEIGEKISESFSSGNEELKNLRDKIATELIRKVAKPIFEKFQIKAAQEFLNEIVEDAVEFRLDPPSEDHEPIDLTELYGVNVVLSQTRRRHQARRF